MKRRTDGRKDGQKTERQRDRQAETQTEGQTDGHKLEEGRTNFWLDRLSGGLMDWRIHGTNVFLSSKGKKK